MSKFTFYVYPVSGAIETLAEVKANFENVGVEEWFGKPAEECAGLDFLAMVHELELTSYDDCFLTNRLFPFCWNDVKDGEEYISEWMDHAKCENGYDYKIVWHFPAVRGEEPADDEWPWHDEKYIYQVEMI